MAILPPRRRRRAVQVGFVVAAFAAVSVADQLAVALATVGSARLGTFVALVGRAAGGWAVGMALRLQLVRAAPPDTGLRLLLGVPAGALSAWPLTLATLPSGLLRALPGWATSPTVTGLAPFAAVVLGLVLALSVQGRR